jgi:hypothetical protein
MKPELVEMAEEVADEAYKLIAEKFRDLDILLKKLSSLESRLDKHVGDFKIDIIETERMITEKYEELVKMNEDSTVDLVSDIQELKDTLNSIRMELNRMKEKVYPRFG